MIVGILSDSHGDAVTTRRAVELLTQKGATTLFHCGDICGTEVLGELAGRDAHFVWGNCDEPTPALRKYMQTLGLTWPTSPLRLERAGRRIAVCHGHERHFEDVLEERDLHYVFFGHTHKYEDRRTGSVRAINPGALHRAKIKTVATLDLSDDNLTFWTLDDMVAP